MKDQDTEVDTRPSECLKRWELGVTEELDSGLRVTREGSLRTAGKGNEERAFWEWTWCGQLLEPACIIMLTRWLGDPGEGLWLTFASTVGTALKQDQRAAAITSTLERGKCRLCPYDFHGPERAEE